MAGAATLLMLCSGAAASAQESFAPLDLGALREQAADYRHRADLLRRSIGIRDRGISQAQSRANEIVANAQADAARQQQAAAAAQGQAQSNQGAMDAVSMALGAVGMPSWARSGLQSGLKAAGRAGVAAADAGAQGAEASGDDEVVQAQRAAAPLREQARDMAGDRKKFALKAAQYEQLADADDLLIAAETLRRQAETIAKSSGGGEKAVESARDFLRTLDVE